MIPDLIYNSQINENAKEGNVQFLTKYGMMRVKFLKEHHRGIYSGKLLTGTLFPHCLAIQQQAEERAERLIKQMMFDEGVNEKLKAFDQIEWVRKMNSINNRVDEIVLSEIVYKVLIITKEIVNCII